MPVVPNALLATLSDKHPTLLIEQISTMPAILQAPVHEKVHKWIVESEGASPTYYVERTISKRVDSEIETKPSQLEPTPEDGDPPTCASDDVLQRSR